jgi:predicted helicase
MLRERFDRIEVIDLRGDQRGERPAGIEDDENVFAIQAGVCITIAIADGTRPEGTEAQVFYADTWRQRA